MSYDFHPLAETEHLESVAFYETKLAGLGASYLAEFEAVMQTVVKHAHRYPVEMEPGIRRVKMRRFPYTILFREIDSAVLVLAVAHFRRDPNYWKSRV